MSWDVRRGRSRASPTKVTVVVIDVATSDMPGSRTAHPRVHYGGAGESQRGLSSRGSTASRSGPSHRSRPDRSEATMSSEHVDDDGDHSDHSQDGPDHVWSPPPVPVVLTVRVPARPRLHTCPVQATISDDLVMAEGDTVFATAGRLHDALAGQVLTRTDFRVPRFATADLSGHAVREVVSRGKHLLVRWLAG